MNAKTIIVVPIEPLSERYTEQWYRRFPEEFIKAGFNVQVIDGIPLLQNEIKVGSFLDINSTVHYKMSQLQEISKMFHLGLVPQGAIFFFGDIEFWGLESVRLMADMNKVQVKITGFLHAASYTIEDAFSIAAPYQRYTEVGWLAACDKVFVGSNYHKTSIWARRLRNVHADYLGSRIVVTQNPLFLDEYKFTGAKKEKKVVMTNRFDPEKRPIETLRLFERLHKKHPDWKFVVTTGRKNISMPAASYSPKDAEHVKKLRDLGVIELKTGLTKAQYHYELETASIMVSHSVEENYGYCIAEALIYGVVPILRKGLSHNELVGNDESFLFENEDDAFIKCDQAMNTDTQELWHVEERLPKVNSSGMQNIINELLEYK